MRRQSGSAAARKSKCKTLCASLRCSTGSPSRSADFSGHVACTTDSQVKELVMQPHTRRAVGPKTTNGHNKPDRTLSHGRPAEPLLRVLPIKRWIPQDVHSMLDYAGGL